MAELPPSSVASYQSLFERLADPVAILDSATFNILEVNPAFERLLGGEPVSSGTSVPQAFGSEFPTEDFEKQLRMARRKFYSRTFALSFPFGGKGTLHFQMNAGVVSLSTGQEVMQLLFRDVTAQKEAELRLHELMLKLENLAVTDEMTQLPNYRFFKRQLEMEHDRSIREGIPYSLIFIDLDHFKHYNDRNGHPAGDRLLRDLAGLLRGCVRKSDTVARYGGEEFVVLCPRANCQIALDLVAPRIRETVLKQRFEHGEHQPLGYVSASIGVAAFPENGNSFETVLKAADDAVYEAKRQGRDRICRAGGSGAVGSG